MDRQAGSPVRSGDLFSLGHSVDVRDQISLILHILFPQSSSNLVSHISMRRVVNAGPEQHFTTN